MTQKLHHIIILFAAFCLSFSTTAQHVSRLGRFQVDFVKGCEGLTVTVSTIAVCDASNSCDVWYEGLSNPGHSLKDPQDFIHTYTVPGTYTLTVLHQAQGYDDIEIVVLPSPDPQVEVYLCSGNEFTVNVTDRNYDEYVVRYSDGVEQIVDETDGYKDRRSGLTGAQSVVVRGRNDNADDNCSSVTKNFTTVASLSAPTINLLQVTDPTTLQLDFTAQPDIQYQLEVAVNNATTFQVYRTLYNVSTITLPNLKPDDNYYCFKLVAFDPCLNQRHESPVICSSNFDLSVQNNSNNLTWATRTTPQFSEFRLTRTTQGNSLTETVTGSTHADKDITCGTEYCYQLTSVYSFGRSISLQKCGTAFSTTIPAAVENITAMVNDPGVELQWLTLPGFTPDEFSILKSTDGSPFAAFATTTTPEVRDDTYVTETATCYKVSYVDVCGNISAPSGESCPIRLEGALQRDNSIQLTWSPYSGWKNGVNDYVVEKYSAEGQLLETLTPGTTLTLLDEAQDDFANQSYRYVVKANASQPGLPQAESNAVLITKSANIFYPSAFTPNGDNLNDLFNVFGQYIVDFEMNIFNRWGELVYTATALDQGWDGTFRGNPMPEGTYTFVAEITDRAGRTSKKSGSVLLLRKK